MLLLPGRGHLSGTSRWGERRQYLLALGLANLAGFVDAIGFLKLGGLFVSYMSGNLTRLAVDVGGAFRGGLLAIIILVMFVAGVVIGALVARLAGGWRKPAVLALTTLLLAATSMLALTNPSDRWLVLLATVSMGVVNNVFLDRGEVRIGVTYMTGTLVKFGQAIAARLLGEKGNGLILYFLLWTGLVSGGIFGAFLYTLFGLAAMWPAVVLSAILFFLSLFHGRVGDPASQIG